MNIVDVDSLSPGDVNVPNYPNMFESIGVCGSCGQPSFVFIDGHLYCYTCSAQSNIPVEGTVAESPAVEVAEDTVPY